jgi:hypothetical protein
MNTIKYYTSEKKYMGWNKFCSKNLAELNSWINSGNYVIINNKIITLINKI